MKMGMQVKGRLSLLYLYLISEKNSLFYRSDRKMETINVVEQEFKEVENVNNTLSNFLDELVNMEEKEIHVSNSDIGRSIHYMVKKALEE